jgi:hypothetical protein
MSSDMGNLAGGCECSWDDGETCSIYERIMRKARKEHWCCECGDPIPKATTYEYVAMLFDGHWSHCKTCVPCMNIMENMGGCVPHGGLREAFYEMFRWNYLDDPADWED